VLLSIKKPLFCFVAKTKTRAKEKGPALRQAPLHASLKPQKRPHVFSFIEKSVRYLFVPIQPFAPEINPWQDDVAVLVRSEDSNSSQFVHSFAG